MTNEQKIATLCVGLGSNMVRRKLKRAGLLQEIQKIVASGNTDEKLAAFQKVSSLF